MKYSLFLTATFSRDYDYRCATHHWSGISYHFGGSGLTTFTSRGVIPAGTELVLGTNVEIDTDRSVPAKPTRRK